MCAPLDAREVVLAMRGKFDVAHDHHLVIAHTKRRPIQNVVSVLVVAAGQEFQRLFVAFRRLAQSFPRRVLAHQPDDLAHVARNPPRVHFLIIVQQNFFRRFRHGYASFVLLNIRSATKSTLGGQEL